MNISQEQLNELRTLVNFAIDHASGEDHTKWRDEAMGWTDAAFDKIEVDTIKEPDDGKEFVELFNSLAKESDATALIHGFDNSKTDSLIQIALIHSELGEATEAIRKDIKSDNHITEFTGLEAELADCVIRCANLAAAKNLRLGEAIIAKMEYNKGRAFRHGNKLY